MGVRLRRSLLFTPGNRPERLKKAVTLGCDALIFDLEDAVPPAEKDAARGYVAEALQHLEFGRRERGVRINPISGPYGRGDLLAVAPYPFDWVVLPKAEDAAQVTQVAQLLQAAGSAAAIIPLVESARGLLAVEAICGAPRVTAVCFGAVDYSLDTGCTQEHEALLYARSRVVTAARAAMVDPIDTPYMHLDDPVGLAAEAEYAGRLGFTGKLVIHPAQLPAVHAAFTPDAGAVARARAVVQAYREAEQSGLGAISVAGQMVDAPVVARAERIIALSEAAAAAEEN